MGKYENSLVENQVVDLSSFNSIAVNCHFRNCQINMADNNEGEECRLYNVIFEDCVINPARIYFSWLYQHDPVILKNTKVDLIGDVVKFFWNGKTPFGDKKNTLSDIQRDYIKKCFSDCTINGKELSSALNEYEASRDDIPYDIDSFIEDKISEISRKH